MFVYACCEIRRYIYIYIYMCVCVCVTIMGRMFFSVYAVIRPIGSTQIISDQKCDKRESKVVEMLKRTINDKRETR